MQPGVSSSDKSAQRWGFCLIPKSINNYIHYKMLDEIMDMGPNWCDVVGHCLWNKENHNPVFSHEKSVMPLLKCYRLQQTHVVSNANLYLCQLLLVKSNNPNNKHLNVSSPAWEKSYLYWLELLGLYMVASQTAQSFLVATNRTMNGRDGIDVAMFECLHHSLNLNKQCYNCSKYII